MFHCIFVAGRYRDEADEPYSSDRVIVFTVSDGTFDGVSSLTLSIETIDDNPTIPTVNGTGSYDYNEGGSPTILAGISLVDEDSSNSDVTVDSVTIEIVNGAGNEILYISNGSSNINVRPHINFMDLIQCLMCAGGNSRSEVGAARPSISDRVSAALADLYSHIQSAVLHRASLSPTQIHLSHCQQHWRVSTVSTIFNQYFTPVISDIIPSTWTHHWKW